MQRHGHEMADRLAQGFTGLIHTNPSSFSWPNIQKPKIFDVEFPHQSFGRRDFELGSNNSGVSAIFDIGNRLGQAGAEFGASINGVVHQFFRRLPVPFRQEEHEIVSLKSSLDSKNSKDMVLDRQTQDFGDMAEKLKNYGFSETTASAGSEESDNDGGLGFDLKSFGNIGRPQATVNMTSSYDSRTQDIENSLVARGDLWRVEASHGGSTSGNENSPLFLVQLGPLLFVHDSTVLLPVHLSKQHLLWYGYDRKKGLHSLCPAVWSKHRRWLLMSMICLNPLACSFMDLQFPNGQFTYVSGEGLTSSVFVPVLGGLLQAQGQLPGEMRFSYSCKNKWGTSITPSVQWPDKSFSLGLVQALAWQRSGLMVKPTVQFSISPTFGGSDPGLRAELIHSVKEKLNLICGCSYTTQPSAFASVSVGRSKWNGNVGSTGIVVRVETPLGSIGRPSFSIQLNSGVEF
ncbi:epstein-barr nuclear antigen [Thalictrum thalictroides]|uniref:Epstein-barr nuclear antigen n=1 Tax=Thalictrum thalictroides TaxID=46969 RepID=A0A7J6W867_THATH|nr:epstein-barr nuclear antigen [Thalictrum thalictroides]